MPAMAILSMIKLYGVFVCTCYSTAPVSYPSKSARQVFVQAGDKHPVYDTSKRVFLHVLLLDLVHLAQQLMRHDIGVNTLTPVV